jgi:hypothetical protein
MLTKDQAHREGQLAGSKFGVDLIITRPIELDYFASGTDQRVSMTLDLLENGRRIAEADAFKEQFGTKASKTRDERIMAFASGFKEGALKEMWDELGRQGREAS